MNAAELIDAILHTAEIEQGMRRSEVLARAGLYASAVSRIRATHDCRFSTIHKLLAASGLRLAIVPDNEAAERLMKGELF